MEKKCCSLKITEAFISDEPHLTSDNYKNGKVDFEIYAIDLNNQNCLGSVKWFYGFDSAGNLLGLDSVEKNKDYSNYDALTSWWNTLRVVKNDVDVYFDNTASTDEALKDGKFYVAKSKGRNSPNANTRFKVPKNTLCDSSGLLEVSTEIGRCKAKVDLTHTYQIVQLQPL